MIKKTPQNYLNHLATSRHFQKAIAETLGFYFKSSKQLCKAFHKKISLICMVDMNSYPWRLGLTQREKATQKWPMVLWHRTLKETFPSEVNQKNTYTSVNVSK